MEIDNAFPLLTETVQNPKPPDPVDLDLDLEEKNGSDVELEEAEVAEDPKAHSTPAISFRDIVAGKEKAKEQWNEKVILEKEDILIDRSGDTISFTLSEKAKELLCKPWRQTLVVKLLGRQIGYTALCNRIQSLWRPNGKVQIIDVENEYYLVKCELRSDFEGALLNGPWVIMGHYLTVQPWTHEFRASEADCSKVTVWIRLPGLPMQLYNESLLWSVGNELGRTIKIDSNTSGANRGCFARLAVEIDIVKPLAVTVNIEGRTQRIEYESLPRVCFACGRIGHGAEGCSEADKSTEKEAREEHNGEDVEKEIEKENRMGQQNQKFGPWIHVQKRNRRPNLERKSKSDTKLGEKTGQWQRESRFSALEGIVEDYDEEQGSDIRQTGVARVRSREQGLEKKRGSSRDFGRGVTQVVGRRQEVSKEKGKEKSEGVVFQAIGSSKTGKAVSLNRNGEGYRYGSIVLGKAKGHHQAQLDSGKDTGKNLGKEGELDDKEATESQRFCEGRRDDFDPGPGRRGYRKSRLPLESSGKRTLDLPVEELAQKSVRPRHEEEAMEDIGTEDDDVSLVESTYQEEPDGAGN